MMKFKLKLLAAAVALVAATGANAAIDSSPTGNGGLFLSVWDDGGTTTVADDRAYVLNLGSLTSGSVTGGHLNDWASSTTTTLPVLAADKQTTPGIIFSVASDANLSSFLSVVTAGTLKWNIAAGDNLSYQRALVTGVDGATTNLKNTTFRGQLPTLGIDNYLSPVNAALGSNPSVVLTGAAANIGIWGDKMNTKVDFSTSAGLDQSLNMYLLSSQALSGATTTPVGFQQFANDTWKLASDGTLTYGAVAAIPEPQTYGMLVAGLLMLGGVARRRNRG